MQKDIHTHPKEVIEHCNLGGERGVPWKPKFSKESMNQNWEIIWGGWMCVPWCQPFSHDMGGIRTSSFVSPLRPMPQENGFRDSVFVICFPTTLNLQLLFPFFHNFGWQISNCHFLFSSFVFVRYWKSEFELRFSFFVSVILSLSCFTWTGRMLAFPVANNRLTRNHILDEAIVFHFLLRKIIVTCMKTCLIGYCLEITWCYYKTPKRETKIEVPISFSI